MAAAAPTDPQLSATTRKKMVARTAERVHVARVTLDQFVASAAALAADDAALLKRLRAAEAARDRGVGSLEEASAELTVGVLRWLISVPAPTTNMCVCAVSR